jgi:hypothetical protein
VLGDTPYSAQEEVRFVEMMKRIDAEDVAFAVHVGDIKGGGACSDALYERRRAQFDASRHPFVYTPGDNEWQECRDAGGRRIGIERLAHLRRVFFSQPESLGRSRIPMQSQDACLVPGVPACGCGALPENRAWSLGGVDFVTLHIVGEDDNRGIDAANEAEADCRAEGNRRWLERAADAAMASDARALVILIQANPWLSMRSTFKPFLAQLERTARRLARPVLFVHGDTHTYRVDHPFEGVTRLETYGSPFVGWVKVTIRPGEGVPFGFDSHLHAFVGTGPGPVP